MHWEGIAVKGYGCAWLCFALALSNLPFALAGKPLSMFSMGWCMAFALAIAIGERESRR